MWLSQGGRDTLKQSQDLDKRPHVVIGTHGRLVDHHIKNNATVTLLDMKDLLL